MKQRIITLCEKAKEALDVLLKYIFNDSAREHDAITTYQKRLVDVLSKLQESNIKDDTSAEAYDRVSEILDVLRLLFKNVMSYNFNSEGKMPEFDKMLLAIDGWEQIDPPKRRFWFGRKKVSLPTDAQVQKVSDLEIEIDTILSNILQFGEVYSRLLYIQEKRSELRQNAVEWKEQLIVERRKEIEEVNRKIEPLKAEKETLMTRLENELLPDAEKIDIIKQIKQLQDSISDLERRIDMYRDEIKMVEAEISRYEYVLDIIDRIVEVLRLHEIRYDFDKLLELFDDRIVFIIWRICDGLVITDVDAVDYIMSKFGRRRYYYANQGLDCCHTPEEEDAILEEVRRIVDSDFTDNAQAEGQDDAD